MNEDRRDEALSKLLRASRAGHDPVLWTRVRARLEADQEVHGVVAWFIRPRALAASLAALALATLLSIQLLNDAVPASYEGATGITDALLGIDETPLDRFVPADDGGTAADSGVTS